MTRVLSPPRASKTKAYQVIACISAIDGYHSESSTVSINALPAYGDRPTGQERLQGITRAIAQFEIAPCIAAPPVLTFGAVRQLRGINVSNSNSLGAAADCVPIVNVGCRANEARRRGEYQQK